MLQLDVIWIRSVKRYESMCLYNFTLKGGRSFYIIELHTRTVSQDIIQIKFHIVTMKDNYVHHKFKWT